MAIDEAVGRLPDGIGVFQPVRPTPGASNQPVSTVAEAGRPVFRVFPNPFRQSAFVSTDNPGQFQLQLASAPGNVLMLKEWAGPNHTLELELSGLPAGLYFLSILEEGRIIQVKRLIKR